jgi:uncharacterized protein YndB with AHSA1/START domain
MSTADTAEHRRSAMTGEINIRDDGPMIVATVLLSTCTTDRALTAFTDPKLVTRWWRGDLTAQPAEGGPYTIDFPAIPAQLTGQVLAIRRGRFEFTWSWDNEAPDSTVLITTTPSAAQHTRSTGKAGSTSYQGWLQNCVRDRS